MLQHRGGIIGDVGDYQLLPATLDDKAVIAPYAIFAHMVEFPPKDAAGGAFPFMQALRVQNKRFRPIGQG